MEKALGDINHKITRRWFPRFAPNSTSWLGDNRLLPDGLISGAESHIPAHGQILQS